MALVPHASLPPRADHGRTEPSRGADAQELPLLRRLVGAMQLRRCTVNAGQELLPAPPAEEAHCDNISITSPALPEAPASLNFRVMIHGYEVQVTLRDSDETRLLARLAALVQQSPLRPVPKPAPRHGQWRKAPH